jgi:hypothetical protein
MHRILQVIEDIVALNLPKRENNSVFHPKIRDLRLLCIVEDAGQQKLEWKEYAERLDWKGHDVVFQYVELMLGIA